jgi:multiple sugar transport system substrate-binding protein
VAEKEGHHSLKTKNQGGKYHMKRTTKAGALVLTAAMGVGLLSGCGGTKNKEITKVTYWSGNSHSMTVVQQAIYDWNDTTGKELGIEIEYVVHGGDSFTQNIELALQSGTAPDIWEGIDTKKLADQGYIMPYDDVFGEEDTAKLIEKYEGKLRDETDTYNGKLYCVPNIGGPYGLIYNKDMFKAAGIVDENGEAKPPRTLEEMRECAKKLTDPSKRQYGIILPKKWDGWFGFDVQSPASSYTGGWMGYNPVTDDYDFSAYKPFMQLIIDMTNDGSVYPGGDSIDNDSARAIFAEGNIGMKYGANFDVGVLNDQFPAQCDWGAVAYPAVDEEHDYKMGIWYGRSQYINAKSEVPKDKLKAVMEFLLSDEYAVTLYKSCVSYPSDASIIKDVKVDNMKTGWEDFGLMVNDITAAPPEPAQDAAGLRTIKNIFLEDILSGKMTIDEGVALAEENARKARERYVESHPDYDTHKYANPDFKPEKKERLGEKK